MSWLVVWNMNFMTVHSVENVIIPIDDGLLWLGGFFNCQTHPMLRRPSISGLGGFRGVFVATTNHHSKITNIDYGRNHQSYRISLLIYIYTHTLVGIN